MVILQQRNMTPATIVRVVASIRFHLYHHILPVKMLLFNMLSLLVNMSPLPLPVSLAWGSFGGTDWNTSTEFSHQRSNERRALDYHTEKNHLR